MRKLLLSTPALTLGILASQARAALPEEVTDAVDEYKANALAGAGLILGAGVVIWGLVKLGRKFGWF